VTNQPPMRRSAASRLRALADRLDPRQQDVTEEPDRASAPLVRFGGRWWQRDEILAPPPESPAPRDELRP
jgi:hypothetical protein